MRAILPLALDPRTPDAALSTQLHLAQQSLFESDLHVSLLREAYAAGGLPFAVRGNAVTVTTASGELRVAGGHVDGAPERVAALAAVVLPLLFRQHQTGL